MFTGIIEATAQVMGTEDGQLMLERPKTFVDMKVGSSICVSGVCLSIVALDQKSMTFDVVPETLRRSTLGSSHPGSAVNLERALPAHGRFDGHVVQGHVEATAEVVAVENRAKNNDVHLAIDVPSDVLPFILPKGSIALDGVSLTVASVTGDRVTVALIPHTLTHTTLGSLKAGDRVNIETDILARYAQSPIGKSALRARH